MWILRSKSASSQLMHGDMWLPRVGHDLARYDHDSTHYRYTTALHILIEFNGAAPGDDPWNHPSVILTYPSNSPVVFVCVVCTACVVFIAAHLGTWHFQVSPRYIEHSISECITQTIL